MGNREAVIELVNKLPEDTPLHEIVNRIELLAGIKNAREQARNRQGTSADEARKLIDSWASR
jgi:hypothetical protein